MEQCKVLLRAIFMGQLAAEELDDTREKYKKMARVVWKNMKERERTLNILRSRVENLWADIRELVRVEVRILNFITIMLYYTVIIHSSNIHFNLI